MADDSDNQLLTDIESRLAQAGTAEERAACHEALAIYWGRRGEFRRMNHHEWESALGGDDRRLFQNEVTRRPCEFPEKVPGRGHLVSLNAQQHAPPLDRRVSQALPLPSISVAALCLSRLPPRS